MNIDLDSLLGGSSSNASSLFDPATLLAPLMPFIILITVASILIGVLYILNMITTYRSHKATIEMRDIMREMNEQQQITFIFSTHDPRLIDHVRRTVWLEDGAIKSDTRKN